MHRPKLIFRRNDAANIQEETKKVKKTIIQHNITNKFVIIIIIIVYTSWLPVDKAVRSMYRPNIYSFMLKTGRI